MNTVDIKRLYDKSQEEAQNIVNMHIKQFCIDHKCDFISGMGTYIIEIEGVSQYGTLKDLFDSIIGQKAGKLAEMTGHSDDLTHYLYNAESVTHKCK